MKNDFYMVLPSDNSMMYYPDNTVACFTTQLPEDIRLEGKWLVAATEFIFPYTFSNVPESVIISAVKPDFTGNLIMDRGFYKEPALFLETLNSLIEKTDVRFVLKKNGYVLCETLEDVAKGTNVAFEASESLCNILGYPNSIHITTGTQGEQPFNLHANMPRELFVYSDICEPSIVGDVHAGLLTKVNVNISKFDYWASQHNTFSMPRYTRLLTNNFRNIIIDIRDRFGVSAPFEGGRSSVTLHFKPMF